AAPRGRCPPSPPSPPPPRGGEGGGGGLSGREVGPPSPPPSPLWGEGAARASAQVRDIRLQQITVPPPSPPLEQFVEPLLPFVLFIGRQQHGDDFLLVDGGHDTGRVGFDVGAGRDAAEFCQEGLRLLAEQKVRRQERRVRMRRLGADADC